MEGMKFLVVLLTLSTMSVTKFLSLHAKENETGLLSTFCSTTLSLKTTGIIKDSNTRENKDETDFYRTIRVGSFLILRKNLFISFPLSFPFLIQEKGRQELVFVFSTVRLLTLSTWRRL